MAKAKMKDEDIHVYMTSSQKKRLQILAGSSNKSLSQYLVDAGLSSNLDHAKINFYENINNDLLYIKKSLYVLTKLTLLVANDTYDQDVIIKFSKAAQDDAEKQFKEE